MKKVIHIINVSAQPIPNVLPVLEDVQKYGTESVAVLICASAQMQERASWIEGFLRDKGVEVRCSSKPTPVDSVNQMLKYFGDVQSEALGSGAEKVVVNLTGGTKLLSIATFTAFFNQRDKIAFIYVDTQGKSSPKCLNILSDDSHEFPEGLLRVEDFLTLYGKHVTNGDLRPRISPADRAFLDDMQKLAQKIPNLNGLLTGWSQNEEWRLPRECLDVFKKNGRVRRNVTGFFRPLDEQKFLTGGWLEHYVYDILKRRGDVQDVATGIKYATEQGVENEADVMFVRNNQLFTVECKTGSFVAERKTGIKTITTGLAYKSKDIISELGSACSGWLISLKELERSDYDRLKNAEKIELCVGLDDTRDIPSWINNQLKKPSAP